MSDTPITERQQYWLDHIRAAEAFDGSVADYARSEGLKPKELYSWKGILARRGCLSVPAADENSGGFVRVLSDCGMSQRAESSRTCDRFSLSPARKRHQQADSNGDWLSLSFRPRSRPLSD